MAQTTAKPPSQAVKAAIASKNTPKAGGIQPRKTTEVSTASDNAIPDYIKQGKQRGSEAVEMSDVVIPRIELVQMLSPCLDPKKPEYIEGAAAGMLYNSVTRELYGDYAQVVPVLFKKEWLVWKDRKQGGGFRGAHASPEDAARRIAEEPEKDQEYFTSHETAQQLVLVIRDDGTTEEAVVSMARTKLKVSKQWNSLIRINGNDRFSRVYKLFGVDDKNDKGEYKNFAVMNAGFPPEAVYQRAEKLYEAIQSGARKMVVDVENDAEADQGQSTEY